MPENRVTEATAFFEKYGLMLESGRIDSNPNESGVQGDVDLDGFAKDYFSLSSEERYVVFARLRRGGEGELLHKMLLGNLPSGWNSKRLDRLTADFKKAKFNDRLWEGRLAIAEELFLYEYDLKDDVALRVDEQMSVTGLEIYHNYYYDLASKLYRVSGKKYWDTDRDFDPYARPDERGVFFDDADAAPLDSGSHRDGDGDFVTTRYDPDDADPKKWNMVPEGGEVKGYGYDVADLGGGKYEVRLNVYLEVADDAADKEKVAKSISADARRRLEADVEKFYRNHVEPVGKDIGLRVRFVDNKEDAHTVVQVTDNDKFRANSHCWTTSAMTSLAVVLHEVLHLLGLPDYYHEPLVDGSARDHTLAPGYELIDPNNIMCNSYSEHAVIRASQMREIVARTENMPERVNRSASEASSKAEDACSQIYYFWWQAVLSEDGISLDGHRDELQELKKTLQAEFAGSHEPMLMTYLARVHWLLGERETAEDYWKMPRSAMTMNGEMRQIMGDRTVYVSQLGDCYFVDLAEDLWAIGRREEAVAILEEIRLKRDRCSYTMGMLSTYLLILKRPDEAYNYAREMTGIELRSLLGYANLVEALFDLGRDEEAWDAYASALKAVGSVHEFSLTEEVSRYFIRSDRIPLAERIYFDKADYTDEAKYYKFGDFANLLAGAKKWKEARQYYEKAFSHTAEPFFETNYSDKYLNTLKAMGDCEAVIGAYKKMISADPYNIWKYDDLAMAYIKAGRYIEAARQLAEIARIAERTENGHRLEVDDFDKAVGVFAKELSSMGADVRSRFIEKLEMVCSELAAEGESYRGYCERLLSKVKFGK